MPDGYTLRELEKEESIGSHPTVKEMSDKLRKLEDQIREGERRQRMKGQAGGQ
jgi:hypothetical protein